MTMRIMVGDARERLRELPDESVHCVVTSPPYYGLRDYGVAGQIGLEPSPAGYVETLVAVFREVRRVLRHDGTLWLNLGDSYCAPGGGFKPDAPSNLAGSKQARTHPHATSAIRSHIRYGCKPKDLIGIPWLIAFALRADGWWLRQDIIWSKPNPMPESVTDRCTKAHEYLFLLSRSGRYYYDAEAIREPVNPNNAGEMSAPAMDGYRSLAEGYTQRRPQRRVFYEEIKGANKRSVWTVTTQPYAEAHFATFPPALVEPCILAGCPKGGTVLDPFFGAGTTGIVADRLGRDCIGIELNPAYAEMTRARLVDDAGMFANVEVAA